MFDLFPLPCSFSSFTSSFQTFPCLVKLVVVEKGLHGIFAFFKTFLASSFCWEIQANLAFHWVFVRVFLLCSSWMYFLMGLSKAINLFELCLWFMANFRENLSKLVETLPTSVNEDWRGAKNNVNAFANWLIHSDSWFLIGWNGFSHVRESRFATVIGWKKFPYEFYMRSILSENLSRRNHNQPRG